MKLKCAVGFHDWSGCKCSRCGKARDEGHAWEKDCERCARCGKTRSDAHAWGGCKCSSCGKTRDESHDWSKDCEKCSRCGAIRQDAHKWAGCACQGCGKKRDEAHVWEGCKCSKCDKLRDEAHNWAENCEQCSTCGKTRSKAHDWSTDSEKCSKCGMPGPKKLFDLGCKDMVNALRSGNASEAMRLFELAARGGHTEAKNMLGVLLVQTGGNLQVAHKWISEAADEGNKIAISNRQQIKYYMNPPGPGAMTRFEYTWGQEPPPGAPVAAVLQAPYRR